MLYIYIYIYIYIHIYNWSDQMLFRQHCLDSFLCKVIWSPSDNIEQDFFLWTRIVSWDLRSNIG